MIDKDLKIFREKQIAEQLEQNMRKKRLEAIKKQIYKKQINLIPHWHIDINCIDLTKQGECLDNHYSISDYDLFQSVELNVLFNHCMPWIVELFQKRKLFTQDWIDWKNSEVIYNWQNGIKLIPPTIILCENNQLFPAEGKHRINVAHYLNSFNIPILVSKNDSSIIKQKLNLIV